MGLGSFKRKQNLKRHANSKEHKVAQRAWEQQKLAPGIETINNTLESATLASTPAASAKDKAASTKSLFPTTAHRAVVATRALLETSGSFRSFEHWRDALGGADRQALESQWHCRRLVSTMAQYEKEVTHRILREGAVFRLAADGLERTYQVEIGTILWSLLASLQHLPAHGEQDGCLEVLGPRGP